MYLALALARSTRATWACRHVATSAASAPDAIQPTASPMTSLTALGRCGNLPERWSSEFQLKGKNPPLNKPIFFTMIMILH